MSRRKILGLILVVGGLALLIVSGYIKNQVAGGKEQISSAEKKVGQANKLFSLSPATKDIGGAVTGGAEKKIKAAKGEVAYYAQLANQLQVGGFIVLAVGIVIFLIPSKKR